MRGPLHGFRQSRVGYATSAGCIPLPRSHGWHDLHPQRVASGAAAAARTTRSVKDAFCRCDVPLQRRCAADDAVNPRSSEVRGGVSLRVSACAAAHVGRCAGENYRPMVPSIARQNARAQTCEHAPSLVGSPNARNLCRRALAKRGYPFIFGCRCVTTIVSCNSGGGLADPARPPRASHRVELNSYCTATLTRNPINNGLARVSIV